MKYKVIKECIDPVHVELVKAGDIINAEEPLLAKDSIILVKMEELGYIEELANYDEGSIVSKLANLRIAREDYSEGDKKHFTYDEAMEIQKQLKDTGWRLPTRHEWILICEELGVKDGELNSEAITSNLGLNFAGYLNFVLDSLDEVSTSANYWSSTESSDNPNFAYSLYFNTSGYFNPSNYGYCHNGRSVRLVKDIKEEFG